MRLRKKGKGDSWSSLKSYRKKRGKLFSISRKNSVIGIGRPGTSLQ
jgi:hypothetical protein